MKSSSLWFSILVFCTFSSQAATQPHYVIRAEHSTSRGHEQTALVIDGSTAKLILNANFLGRPGKSARLGEFISNQPSDFQSTISELEQISHRIPKGQPSYSPSPHSIQIFLDHEELDPHSDYGAALLVILERAQTLGSWIPHNAVEIRKTASGTFVKELLNNKSKSSTSQTGLSCKVDEQIVCLDPQWGTAYLSK